MTVNVLNLYMINREREDPMLGILGGMGPEATINFQQELLAETPAEIDQEHIVTLVSNDSKIPDRNAAILDEGESPLPRLQNNTTMLEEAGADIIAMPCNTAHHYYDQLATSTEVEIIDMIRTVLNRLEQDGIRRAGLLATKTVLDIGIYDTYFKDSSVELVTPKEENCLMNSIYAVKRDNHREATEVLSPIIANLERADCEALIIGCSDLSILSIESELTEYDSVTLLARECINRVNRLR